MAGIPVKYAIESGFWLKQEGRLWGRDWRIDDCSFRIRVREFNRLNPAHFDKPEKISPIFDLESGDFWLLRFDVVSLCVGELDAKYLHGSIILVDHEGFEFHSADDSWLCYVSDFAKRFGLYGFKFAILNPKVKFNGAMLYYLPREDGAEYSIAVSGDVFCEV